METIKLDPKQVRVVFEFLREREKIRLKKERGEPKPWTRDPVLRNYRFTQVHRENDKTTVWLRKTWRDPYAKDPLLWFAMCVARYINWPPTLEAIGYPIPWKRQHVIQVMEAIRSGDGAKYKQHVCKATLELFRGDSAQVFGRSYKIDAGQSRQLFGGAYFLNSIGPKIQSVVNDRLTLLWNTRKQITKQIEAAKTLEEVYNVLKAQYGYGSFMAGQVIAELKYTGRFKNMPDWDTFAVPGPGSKRGLNRVCGRPVNAPWRNDVWLATIHQLQAKLNPMLEKAGIQRLCSQDSQGACCEIDKLLRARNGEGRPKVKYPGGKEDGNRIK